MAEVRLHPNNSKGFEFVPIHKTTQLWINHHAYILPSSHSSSPENIGIKSFIPFLISFTSFCRSAGFSIAMSTLSRTAFFLLRLGYFLIFKFLCNIAMRISFCTANFWASVIWSTHSWWTSMSQDRLSWKDAPDARESGVAWKSRPLLNGGSVVTKSTVSVHGTKKIQVISMKQCTVIPTCLRISPFSWLG